MKNIFTRVMIVIFILFLIVLVISSFYFSNEKLHFNTGIITVLLLILTLVLAETFDSLSVGKILQLSREKAEKERQVEEVKTENRELRENIINFATMIKNSQVQSNNSFYGLPNEFYKMIGVKQSDEDNDKETEYDEEIEYTNQSNKSCSDSLKNDKPKKDIPIYKLIRYMEKDGIMKFMEARNINPKEIIYSAEFSSTFEGIDPIMDRRRIFDGYYKTVDEEVFIEIKINNRVNSMTYDRLYVMLSRILHYRKAKGVKAKLILLLLDYPENEINNHMHYSTSTDKFKKVFDPALRSQLLEIHTIQFTNEEITKYKQEYIKNTG